MHSSLPIRGRSRATVDTASDHLAGPASETVGSADNPIMAIPAPAYRKSEAKVRDSVASKKRVNLRVFHFFPFLPMKLRLKIWREMIPGPRIVHVVYDVDIHEDSRFSYLHGLEPYGTWRLDDTVFSIPNPYICRESRSEFLKDSPYEIFHLKHDITKRTWINYATDTLFLNTNARDPDGAGEDQERVLPPLLYHSPLTTRVKERVKTIAISKGLWVGWFFLEDLGPDVSFDECAQWAEDDTRQSWRELFCTDLKAEKLQLALMGDMVGLLWEEFTFKKPEDRKKERFHKYRFKKDLESHDCGAEVEVVEVCGA